MGKKETVPLTTSLERFGVTEMFSGQGSLAPVVAEC